MTFVVTCLITSALVARQHVVCSMLRFTYRTNGKTVAIIVRIIDGCLHQNITQSVHSFGCCLFFYFQPYFDFCEHFKARRRDKKERKNWSGRGGRGNERNNILVTGKRQILWLWRFPGNVRSSLVNVDKSAHTLQKTYCLHYNDQFSHCYLGISSLPVPRII